MKTNYAFSNSLDVIASEPSMPALNEKNSSILSLALLLNLFQELDFLVYFLSLRLMNCPEDALSLQCVSKEWFAAIRRVPIMKESWRVDSPNGAFYQHYSQRWLDCFESVTSIELDLVLDDYLKRFNYNGAQCKRIPSVQRCTLRFVHNAENFDRRFSFLIEFSAIFPSITHLTVIGPVILFDLQLPKLTHLRLVNADPRCARLPQLEKVDFCIRDLCWSYFNDNIPAELSESDIGGLSLSTLCDRFQNYWINRLRQNFSNERDESKESFEIIVDVRSAIYTPAGKNSNP
jgi:hypothetical protein